MSILDLFRSPAPAMSEQRWFQGTAWRGSKTAAGMDVSDETAMTYSAVANAMAHEGPALVEIISDPELI